MAKRKKKTSWVKPVLIIGGVAVGVLFGLPVLMNYLQPGGTINPTLPMDEPVSQNRYSPRALSGILGIL